MYFQLFLWLTIFFTAVGSTNQFTLHCKHAHKEPAQRSFETSRQNKLLLQIWFPNSRESKKVSLFAMILFFQKQFAVRTQHLGMPLLKWKTKSIQDRCSTREIYNVNMSQDLWVWRRLPEKSTHQCWLTAPIQLYTIQIVYGCCWMLMVNHQVKHVKLEFVDLVVSNWICHASRLCFGSILWGQRFEEMVGKPPTTWVHGMVVTLA